MTNIVIGLCSMILVCVTMLGGLSQALAAHTRAASAADLAALAAADAVRGLAPGDPCTVAEEVVERNGARLLDCRASRAEHSAVVEVAVEIPGPLPEVEEESVAGI